MNYHLWDRGKKKLDKDGFWFRQDRCVRCGCVREMMHKMYNGSLTEMVYVYKYFGFTFISENRPNCKRI